MKSATETSGDSHLDIFSPLGSFDSCKTDLKTDYKNNENTYGKTQLYTTVLDGDNW